MYYYNTEKVAFMVKLGHVFGIMLTVGCALNIAVYIYILFV